MKNLRKVALRSHTEIIEEAMGHERILFILPMLAWIEGYKGEMRRQILKYGYSIRKETNSRIWVRDTELIWTAQTFTGMLRGVNISFVYMPAASSALYPFWLCELY